MSEPTTTTTQLDTLQWIPGHVGVLPARENAPWIGYDPESQTVTLTMTLGDQNAALLQSYALMAAPYAEAARAAAAEGAERKLLAHFAEAEAACREMQRNAARLELDRRTATSLLTTSALEHELARLDHEAQVLHAHLERCRSNLEVQRQDAAAARQRLAARVLDAVQAIALSRYGELCVQGRQAEEGVKAMLGRVLSRLVILLTAVGEMEPPMNRLLLRKIAQLPPDLDQLFDG